MHQRIAQAWLQSPDGPVDRLEAKTCPVALKLLQGPLLIESGACAECPSSKIFKGALIILLRLPLPLHFSTDAFVRLAGQPFLFRADSAKVNIWTASIRKDMGATKKQAGKLLVSGNPWLRFKLSKAANPIGTD